MTTSSWDRSRRIAATVSVLTVITVVAGTVILALGVGLPDAWWPHTGQAFAAEARPAHHGPCALIAGPARASCERGSTSAAGQQDTAGAGWWLVPAGAGVAALVVWQLQYAAGQRRR